MSSLLTLIHYTVKSRSTQQSGMAVPRTGTQIH